jgi:hypothetical protein
VHQLQSLDTKGLNCVAAGTCPYVCIDLGSIGGFGSTSVERARWFDSRHVIGERDFWVSLQW